MQWLPKYLRYLVLYADTSFHGRKFFEEFSNNSVLVVHARHVQRSVLIDLQVQRVKHEV